MKRKTLFATLGTSILILLFSQCQTVPQKTEISLTNQSSIDLTDKAISIDRSQLTNLPQGVAYPLVVSTGGDTIASQLNDPDGDKKWDE